MNQKINKLMLNNVRELRFILCQKNASSLGMRLFSLMLETGLRLILSKLRKTILTHFF